MQTHLQRRFWADKLKIGEGCRGLFSICESCPAKFVEEEGEGVQVYDVETVFGKHVCWSMSFVKNAYFVETFRDVSNVVHCIVEVERQRAHKEAILNSIVEAILVVDKGGLCARTQQNSPQDAMQARGRELGR